VAEDTAGRQGFLVRAGVFKDVDAVLFTHVGKHLDQTMEVTAMATGMLRVGIQLSRRDRAFRAGTWRGKSALQTPLN